MFLNKIKPGFTVVEYGTRRWGANSTHHKELWPDCKHIGIDFIDGQDVDQVQDVHSIIGLRDIDAVFSASTFEHLHSPWIAAAELLRILRPGGFFFIQTHQSFPIHGYPHDYFRYTKEGLTHLFERVGAVNLISDYEFESRIVPVEKRHGYNEDHISFLNVCLYGEKND